MKKIFTTTLLLVGLLIQSKAQTIDANSVPKVAPGITYPINYPNNPIILTLTTCDSPDIRVFPSPQPQSEIHLSINKQNPQVLLLSSNTFPYSPNGQLLTSGQGAYWSTNGGLTWNGNDVLPNGAFGRADPSTAFDALGNGYIATLNATTVISNNMTGYLIQRTNNNGATWQPQVHGADINSSDKEMIAADDLPSSSFANNLYCAWSVNPGTNGTVRLNRTTNQGVTFSAPITLKNGWGQGTNVQTGPNGEVYVCWADYTNGDYPEQGLGFVRSTDGGQTFTSSSVVFNYTGIRQNNGGNPDFGNIRVNSFPSMAVDKSNGVHRGRIYVVYTQKENGNGKAIISLRFSDNNGLNWSNASTISIPNGRQNWFPWVAVDDTNGDIFVVYYSLDGATGFSTNTYVASSNNGGASFVNQRVSDVAHITAPIPEFGGGYTGDYIGITAHSGRAFASWTDNRSGQWQIYVSQVRNIDILGDNSFCNTSNIYSLTNLPSDANIQWQASPTGIVSINSATLPQTTLTKTGNGTITLSALISDACVGNITVLKENIRVGTYTTSDLNGLVSAESPVCRNRSVYCNFDNTNMPDVTNYTWAWGSGLTYYSGQGTTQLVLLTSSSFNGSSVRIKVTNTCGTSPYSKSQLIAYDPGCSTYIVSPNPSSGILTVEPTVDRSSNEVTTLATEIQEVEMIDKMGILRYKAKFSASTTVTFNVGNLPNDLYTIRIFDGNQWYTQKVVIQH